MSISLAVAVILLSAPVWGNEWALDKNHSVVQFGVKHVFSTVMGTFSDFDAVLVFDPKNPGAGKFDFTIKVASINTGNTKRDNHLRSKDFFDEKAFPLMRFTSSKIIHKGGNKYMVTGTMTLKETSKTMEIPFIFHGTAPSPFKPSQIIAGFDTRFDLERLDFKVGNGKFAEMGVVGKTVRVTLSIEAVSEP
jgi:polyisoprenoid-binding protein YceI